MKKIRITPLLLALGTALLGAVLFGQSLPQPDPISQADMIAKIGEQQLLMDAKDRYIEKLKARIVELQNKYEPKPGE